MWGNSQGMKANMKLSDRMVKLLLMLLLRMQRASEKNALEKEKQPNRVKRNGIIVCNALKRTEDNQKSQCIHLAAAAAALQRKNKQAREKNGRQNKEESENVKYWNGKSGRICAL